MSRALGRQVVVLTGDKELLAKFDALKSRVASAVSRKALTAGAGEMRDEIRFQIPPTKTRGHSNRGLKRNIGSRLKRSGKSGQQAAIAGVGVGKTRKQAAKSENRFFAPHFHLLALGTARRYTGHRVKRRKGGNVRERTSSKVSYRGRMTGDDFVGRAYRARGGKAIGLMIQIMRDGIERAAAAGGVP